MEATQMDNLATSIAACCKQLKLSSNLAERAMTEEGGTHQDYLYRLLAKEVEYRRLRRITKYMNTAGFPRRYAREQFRSENIVFPAGVTVDSLLDLDFMHQGKNVIMYGGSGTGKTMLSILIGMSACSKGIPVRFCRTAGLVNRFAEHKASLTLTSFKKTLDEAEILILDEFGYVPYDRTGAQLLFDYLSEIHERKSVVLNTNLEFSQWPNVLYDERMATALIGRLAHHVELLVFTGSNVRLLESSINSAISGASGN